MGFWDFVGETIIKTTTVAAGTAAIACGLALTFVPIVGDAAGGALYGAGSAMVVLPIKNAFQGKELDFEELGDKMCKSAEFGAKIQIENGYESPSLMPSYDGMLE